MAVQNLRILEVAIYIIDVIDVRIDLENVKDDSGTEIDSNDTEIPHFKGKGSNVRIIDVEDRKIDLWVEVPVGNAIHGHPWQAIQDYFYGVYLTGMEEGYQKIYKEV